MSRQRYDSLDLLTYSRQLDFKSWASHHGLTKKAGADYYFDFVTPVDATKPSQPKPMPAAYAPFSNIYFCLLRLKLPLPE